MHLHVSRFVVLEQGNVPHDPEVIDQSFMSLWGELLSGREVACSSINGVDSKWKLSASPPDAIVLDVSHHDSSAAFSF